MVETTSLVGIGFGLCILGMVIYWKYVMKRLDQRQNQELKLNQLSILEPFGLKFIREEHHNSLKMAQQRSKQVFNKIEKISKAIDEFEQFTQGLSDHTARHSLQSITDGVTEVDKRIEQLDSCISAITTLVKEIEVVE